VALPDETLNEIRHEAARLDRSLSWSARSWSRAAINPIVDLDLHGALAARPQLQPATNVWKFELKRPSNGLIAADTETMVGPSVAFVASLAERTTTMREITLRKPCTIAAEPPSFLRVRRARPDTWRTRICRT
jgi:hypothetical protein